MLDNYLTIGAVELECFPIPHDAVDPVGFTFYYQKRKLALATDVGTVANRYRCFIYGRCSGFEANHDREMLANGPYRLSQTAHQQRSGTPLQ